MSWNTKSLRDMIKIHLSAHLVTIIRMIGMVEEEKMFRMI